jgi:hypothetical protein
VKLTLRLLAYLPLRLSIPAMAYCLGTGITLDLLYCLSSLARCEWSASRPGHFTSGERTPVPIEYETRWASEPFWTRWWREKFPDHAGNRTVEPRSSSP